MLAKTNFERLAQSLQDQGKLGPGRIFYVNNGTAQHQQNGASNSTNGGLSSKTPLATIDYATGLCTAGRGDNVVVLPTHSESVIAAAGMAMDVAGVTYWGLGNGTSRPTITFTTVDSADIDIDAANVTISNFIFVNGIDELIAGIDVNAASCSLLNCEFQMTTGAAGVTTQTIDMIVSDATADGLTIKDCFAWGLVEAATPGHFLYDIGASNVTIENNFISSGFVDGEGAIFQDTAAGENWAVVNNRVNNINAACTVGMSLHANTTGVKHDNVWGILGGATPVIAAGMQWGRDWEQGAVGTVSDAV